MFKNFLALILCFLFFASASAEDVTPILSAEIFDPQTPLVLDLKDALEFAISKNLDIQIDQTDSKIAQLNYQIQKGVYAPKIGTESYYQNDVQPVANAIAGGTGGKLITESWVSNSFLRGTSPFGTQYSLDFNNTRQRTNNFFQLLVPEYTSNLGLTITQPLLKNLWMNDNRRQIKVLKINKNIADSELMQTLHNTAYSTENAYWDLVLAHKNLKISEESVRLAEEQLRRTRRLGEIGESPKIEAVTAEAELQRRKDEVFQARDRLHRAESTLKLYMADGLDSGVWLAKLQVIDDLKEKEFAEFDPQKSLLIALNNRPEILQLGERLKIKGIERSYLINQGLPQADLVGQYTLNGLAGSERPRPVNFGFGNSGALPRFRGDYSDNLENLFSNDFQTIRVGINFSWPVSPGTTKKVLQRNDLEKQQINLQLEQVQQRIFTDLSDSLNSIQQSRERVTSAKAFLAAAEKQLAAEEQKFKIGLSTNFMVLTRQNDLSQAKVRLATAVADYNKAINEFHKAQGTILSSNNIVMSNNCANCKVK